MNTRATTYATTLTSPGRGAIAIVVVWGADVRAVISSLFQPYRRSESQSALEPDRPRVGRLGDTTGDEVVIVFGNSPEHCEIQCHGGTAAVRAVLGLLRSRGARVVSTPYWLHATQAGRIEAQAEYLLAAASTTRAAGIYLDQANGALRSAVKGIIELCKAQDCARALDRIRPLLSRAIVGIRLGLGFNVVLCGKPNVGKSMLINALVGFERTIVDPTPGTTRDAVTTQTACGGWPVALVDTAGLREATDPIEAAGVNRARERQRKSDLVIVVLDRSAPLDRADTEILAEHAGALVVSNKADLPAAWDAATVGAFRCSALTGEGVDRVVATIAARLVPDPIQPGDAVPFRPAHERVLSRASDHLRRGDATQAATLLESWLRPFPERFGTLDAAQGRLDNDPATND